MATGAPGTNGVWQYGEDDSEATFSALLNKAASTTDTQIGADRTRLTALEARKLSGFVPITITAGNIAISGGTATISNNEVTFSTGTTSISFNNVFSSAFRNYRIQVTNATSSVTNGALLFRYRTSGSDWSATAYYQSGITADYNTSPSGYSLSAASRLDFGLVGHSIYPQSTSSQIDVFNPSTSNKKQAIARTVGGASGNQTYVVSGAYDSAITIDGFTIFPTNGSFTGKLQIFGY